MLEFFVIFSKSGIVLFATVHQSLNQVVNGLVKHVFLEERTGQYQTDQLQIKYLLDNEFELVYVVGYQKFLQLSYVDKFLSDIQLAFRDKYSDFDLRQILNMSFRKQAPKLRLISRQEQCSGEFAPSAMQASRGVKRQRRLDFCDLIIDEANVVEFQEEFSSTYEHCVKSYNHSQPRQESMRSFQDSAKSKKTIASMLNTNQEAEESAAAAAAAKSLASKSAKGAESKRGAPTESLSRLERLQQNEENTAPGPSGSSAPFKPPASVLAKLASRAGDKRPPASKKAKKGGDSAGAASKKGKAARQWELSGSNPDEFDFSKKPLAGGDSNGASDEQANSNDEQQGNRNTNSASMSKNVLGATGAGQLSLEDVAVNLQLTDSENSDEEESNEEEEEDLDGGDYDNNRAAGQPRQKSYLSSIWKTISYNKTLTEENLAPVLEQLREHLTAKNVAAEIAEELCKSVSAKLAGQTINTWVNLKKFAREALQEAILTILNPNRSINILRAAQAKQAPPYVIVFCGVNGVGKSTNLAKIANWLMNNKLRVLVVACDTFRAGAVEQLKTHVMALKSIHERSKEARAAGASRIELFERGYGKDSAAIAWDAIKYARNNQFDVVMVDTAGRMQDNEPLMKELAKLIKINTPDLTLFVGEALVGNEAVDQLTKFNRSLLDCGCRVDGSSRSAIDGIVLTKFDTIDDQVGAAISMTYVTGQPIVFVGVGQTYRDLKQLDAKAVTKALMR